MKKSNTPLIVDITFCRRVSLNGKDFRHASASDGTTNCCAANIAHGSDCGAPETTVAVVKNVSAAAIAADVLKGNISLGLKAGSTRARVTQSVVWA